MGLVGLAAGAGSLWVASKEAGEVLRVDPANGHVQARIAMKSPWWLAYAAGAVWAVSDQGGLARIDAATNSVTATAPVPKPLSGSPPAAAAWTANETKGTVYKVDQTGEIVATYRTGDGARSVSFNGALWVANSDAGTRRRSTRHPAPSARTASVTRSATPSPSAVRPAVHRRRPDGRGSHLGSAGEGREARHPHLHARPTDPATASEPVALEIERATTAGLLACGGAGLRPELAASMPTVSADGRTYTFRVRRGLRFSPPSNAPITADVIRDSVERALSPKLGSVRPGARFLRDLAGCRPTSAGCAAYLRHRCPWRHDQLHAQGAVA